MSKAHRGSGVRELVRSGRGECPICKRSGIKVVHDFEAENKKLKICKTCKSAVAHGKKQKEVAAL